MSIYKELKELSNFCFNTCVRLTRNVYLTDNASLFNDIVSIKKLSDKRIIGYHAIDLRGTQRKRISVNRIEIFKQITTVSECELLAKYIFENSAEIESGNIHKKGSNIKTELEIFCSNYHPFDFYKYYEKRLENKINCSYLKDGIVERESFNVGEMTLFLVDKISLNDLDFVEKNGENRRVDRKYDAKYSNSFNFRERISKPNDFEYDFDRTIIFEFSGKSHYKSLFEMLDY